MTNEELEALRAERDGLIIVWRTKKGSPPDLVLGPPTAEAYERYQSEEGLGAARNLIIASAIYPKDPAAIGELLEGHSNAIIDLDVAISIKFGGSVKEVPSKDHGTVAEWRVKATDDEPKIVCKPPDYPTLKLFRAKIEADPLAAARSLICSCAITQGADGILEQFQPAVLSLGRVLQNLNAGHIDLEGN